MHAILIFSSRSITVVIIPFASVLWFAFSAPFLNNSCNSVICTSTSESSVVFFVSVNRSTTGWSFILSFSNFCLNVSIILSAIDFLKTSLILSILSVCVCLILKSYSSLIFDHSMLSNMGSTLCVNCGFIN